MDKEGVFSFGLITGIIIMVIITAIQFLGQGDNFDAVNMRAFGSELCSAQNLSYDHVEYFKKGEGNDAVFLPRIYCKNSSSLPNAVPIIDGVVVRMR